MNRIIGIVSLMITLCVSVLADNEARIWTSTTGKTITGSYIRHYEDTLEISGSTGQVIKVDIQQLSIEDARVLYPTISQAELEKPIPEKGMYNSRRARETLFNRTHFVDIGRKHYGRLYAFSGESYFFQDPNGGVFEFSSIGMHRMKDLAQYIEYNSKQIPPKLNAARLNELAPLIQQNRLKAIERRAAAAEEAAGEALRLQNNSNPRNPQIPPGFRPINGTWVSP